MRIVIDMDRDHFIHLRVKDYLVSACLYNIYSINVDFLWSFFCVCDILVFLSYNGGRGLVEVWLKLEKNNQMITNVW